MSAQTPTRPSDVTEERTWFDALADVMSNVVAKAPFFLVCTAFIVLWAAAGPVVDFSHKWVDTLVIAASLVTFFMVALLENEAWRANKATQRKLNAIASALAEVMENADINPEHVRQLNSAVGLEKRESASR